MKCSNCQTSETKVIESRDVADGDSIRRRRECLNCGQRFTTYERIERPNLIVIKRNKERQLFDRRKLLAGLARACEKRPVISVQLEDLVGDIERRLYATGEAEISSKKIGEMVMSRLAKLDDVAYVRFASVYRDFTDIASFERELSKLKKSRHKL